MLQPRLGKSRPHATLFRSVLICGIQAVIKKSNIFQRLCLQGTGNLEEGIKEIRSDQSDMEQ